jgi:oligosaccharide repeat unit polymerase
MRATAATLTARFAQAQAVCLGAVLLLFLGCRLFGVSWEPMLDLASAIVVLQGAGSVASWWRITGRLFDPYVLFVLAATLFNGGQALLELLRLNELGILDNRFSVETTLGSLLFTAAGLGALHLGALLALVPRARSEGEAEEPGGAGETVSGTDLRLAGILLIVTSFLPAFVELRRALSIVMAAGYFGLYQQDATTGIAASPRVFAAFLVPGALFLLAGSRGWLPGILGAAAITGTYFLASVFLGTRAAGVMPLLAFAWLFHRSVRLVPRTVLAVGGAITLFVLLPLIGETRGWAGEERLAPSLMRDSLEQLGNPIVAVISEMGGTLKTSAYALELVPAVRGFDWGLGYVYAVSTVVPNVAWTVHPAVAHGLFSTWLVQTVDPVIAARGGGLGFSFIAEAYVNFGAFGGALALIVIGWLLGRLVEWSVARDDPSRLALMASFLAFFLIFARSESAVVFRPLVWYSLGPYLLVRALAAVRRRLRATA